MNLRVVSTNRREGRVKKVEIVEKGRVKKVEKVEKGRVEKVEIVETGRVEKVKKGRTPLYSLYSPSPLYIILKLKLNTK